jgi:hypothetical protein
MAYTLDGTNDYWRAGNIPITSSKKFTFGAWVKFGSNTGVLEYIIHGTSAKFEVFRHTDDTIFVRARNAANSVILTLSTTATYDDETVYRHIGVSVDLGNSRGQLYINGTAATLVTNTVVDDTIDWSGISAWGIGATASGTANPLLGSMAEILLCPGVSLDLSDADDMKKLLSSDGVTESQTDQYRQNAGPNAGRKPVGYGADGSLPFDARPAIYLSGTFSINRGTGGNFTLNGAPTYARDPSVYRSSALRPTTGERWFESEQSGFSYPRSKTIIETREGLSSHGKRIGLDEVDDRTRNEKPGLTFQQLIQGRRKGREDDSEDSR